MNEKSDNTVIILGTGATVGSGYTCSGQRLPGDRGFFGNSVVQKRLLDYPALDIMLGVFRKVHGKDFDKVGLEEVWTFFEFSSKDVYRQLTDLTKERRDWLGRICKPGSKSDDEHFWSRFYREDRTIPMPTDIDMSLLAGWDLRRLLSRIYGEVDAPHDGNVYESLLKNRDIPKDCTTTFISLNYDFIVEDALTRAGLPWYYVHIPTSVERDPSGIQVIKPHGSLNWVFKGNVPCISIATDYKHEPVANRSFDANRFEEAMIIQPTQLKQAINIRETQAPETQRLLSHLWKSMANALTAASRVFIIGYSFPSTDHHLRTLFYQVNHKRDFGKYEEVHCCTRADGGQEKLVFANANRFFPAEKFHPHDRGFADFASEA